MITDNLTIQTFSGVIFLAASSLVPQQISFFFFPETLGQQKQPTAQHLLSTEGIYDKQRPSHTTDINTRSG